MYAADPSTAALRILPGRRHPRRTTRLHLPYGTARPDTAARPAGRIALPATAAVLVRLPGPRAS
ncbi:hypothetical protein [Actinacidiphila epipremni]|uniref:Uncharacterized protein n=1 Tax=Actinacidiphila epipremni TaxID=2053013 RepID=A0ABX0ZNN4_9ACTN|nr:hypothetical protein [Actinacidiphila epipremni]NJP43208.1 hypothetical protein [Actinacidiphila epipremni]